MRNLLAGETKEQFVFKIVNAKDVIAEYPEAPLRNAYAEALFTYADEIAEQKDRLSNESDPWPHLYKSFHLETGLVRYENMGAPDPKNDGKRGDLTLNLKKDTIDKLRPSAIGKPVVNEVHKDMKPSDFKKGMADGIITNAYWDGAEGKEAVEYLLWDKGAMNNAKNGYGVSCSYEVTDHKMEPSLHNNIPFDGTVESGIYNHLAIVKNPRYEQAGIILLNSLDKGGAPVKDKKEGFLKAIWNTVTGKSEADVEASKTMIAVEGEGDVTLENLIADHKKAKALREKTEAPAKLENTAMVDVGDGVMVSVADLVKDRALLKKASNAAPANCGAECGKHATKELHDAAIKVQNETDAEKKRVLENNFRELEEAARKGQGASDVEAPFSLAASLKRGQEMFSK